MTERSQYTFSLLREATCFRIPSPVPEAQEKLPHLNVQGPAPNEKKGKRVVFNEVVNLYREVVKEPEYLDEDGIAVFRDFDKGYYGVY